MGNITPVPEGLASKETISSHRKASSEYTKHRHSTHAHKPRKKQYERFEFWACDECYRSFGMSVQINSHCPICSHRRCKYCPVVKEWQREVNVISKRPEDSSAATSSPCSQQEGTRPGGSNVSEADVNGTSPQSANSSANANSDDALVTDSNRSGELSKQSRAVLLTPTTDAAQEDIPTGEESCTDSDWDSLDLSDRDISSQDFEEDPLVALLSNELNFLDCLIDEFKAWKLGSADDNDKSPADVANPSSTDTGGVRRFDTSNASGSLTPDAHFNSDGKRPLADPSPTIGSKRRRSETRNRCFACPFWKANSAKHHCLRYMLSRIRDVKQHLNRHHGASYCHRCGKTFPVNDPDSLASHYRLEPPDQCLIQNFQVDCLTYVQKNLLKRPVKGCQEDQWFAMWDIIFPAMHRPSSPYVDRGASEEIDSFMAWAESRGPRAFRTVAIENRMWPENDARADRLLRRVLPLAFQRIYDEWVAQQTPNTVPTPSSTLSHEAASEQDSLSFADEGQTTTASVVDSGATRAQVPGHAEATETPAYVRAFSNPAAARFTLSAPLDGWNPAESQFDLVGAQVPEATTAANTTGDLSGGNIWTWQLVDGESNVQALEFGGLDGSESDLRNRCRSM